MGKKRRQKKIKARESKSLVSGKSLLKNPVQKKNLSISFESLDPNQGQTIHEWESESILANAIETLKGYCTQRAPSCFDKKFKLYGKFPPTSLFKHPSHVPPDVNWGAMHVGNKQILAGHFFEDIFYVVFLDKEHEFFPSKKKNT